MPGEGERISVKTMEEKNELIEQMYKNMQKLVDAGISPFGQGFPNVQHVEDVVKEFSEGKECRIAGRVMASRVMGKSIFMDLRDWTGKVQLYGNKTALGEQMFGVLKGLDIGDIIGVDGKLFKTHSGENTVQITSFTVLSKILRPLPEKWHGLK
ncbi:MAG TPA: OB-fold nucleic acid binding domain-containing protein, partial [Candidatus Omnitrophota bacterium]|nr:OB-fold nucleic acid binding domain-containing protein [Candidatus Omnitrophota bacterium]